MATFFNSATLSYNGNVTNSNVVTGTLVEVLAATKTAVRDNYAAGEKITYVISLVNTGSTPVTGVTVSDDLGAYTFGTGGDTRTPLTLVDGSILYYVNGELQTTPGITAGPPAVISGITVPAGGNAAIVYEAIPNQFAPLGTGGTINNTATITGTGIATPILAEATVAASTDPNLTISKSLSPSTVAENGQLTYTFLIQNYGNTATDATDDVVLSDTFNPILRDLAVNFNGTNWTGGTNYNYNQDTGLFTTQPGTLTVPGAVYAQDPATGVWAVTPGVSTLTITGTV